MGFKIKKTEGGHKRGHSNVCHWTGTEEIKATTKKVRRQQDKTEITDALKVIVGEGGLFFFEELVKRGFVFKK